MYQPLLVKHGLKESEGYYLKRVKRAQLNAVFSGESKLKVAVAVLLAQKNLPVNIYLLDETPAIEYPRLPTLVIETENGESEVCCSVGTPVSGAVSVSIAFSEGVGKDEVCKQILALNESNLKVTVKEGNPLKATAFYFNENDLERFTMALARITANVECKVEADYAYAPLTQSNEMLTTLFSVLGKTKPMPTEFCLKPYHAIGGLDHAIVRIVGESEDVVKATTKIIDELTEETQWHRKKV